MGLENIHLLGPDERRVVGRIVDRLLAGQEKYGELHLAVDKRNWRQEGTEELEDFLVYLAAREVAKADKEKNCASSDPRLVTWAAGNGPERR